MSEELGARSIFGSDKGEMLAHKTRAGSIDKPRK